MFTSFATALSALSAHSTAVDVVGNNLANLNTPGFKNSVVSFRDLVSQSIGSGIGDTQIGFGTARPLTIRQFIQGAIQTSSGLLDAAIQGDGFFVVRNNITDARLYTRAGGFQVDAFGQLLTAGGERVQGWTEGADGVVDTNGPVGDILLPVGATKQPRPTSRFSVDLNLDAAAVNGEPSGTFSTPIEVVDTLGATHVLTITFTKTATANEWDYSVTIPGTDVGSASATEELVSGNLTFDGMGHLTSPDSSAPSVEITLSGLANGASDVTLDWDIYSPTLTPRLTQFIQPSAVSANTQDGSPSASLTRVALADGGRVVAQYSNGEQKVIGVLAMASIRNPESLIAVGGNNFGASAATALPAIGTPETGGRGKVVGGALEYSTVDIGREFTNLIIYQRGYQANSRVVVAMDEISEETINLKR